MEMKPRRLSIIRPDDWHLHVRDGEGMAAVLPFSARRFGRAGIMPNLKPPVTTVAQALAYRECILRVLPAGTDFDPRMFIYLTDNTSVEEVARAAQEDLVLGFKLYPAGATTNSDAGVTDIDKLHDRFEAMERSEVPLCVHGEVTDLAVDIFDRERVFIERVLVPIRRGHPALKIVLEHVTTKDGVDYVNYDRSMGSQTAATITAHHLLLNRNAIFQGGVRPHHYCLPVLKRETHRQALVAAVASGSPGFFLGTDSAPHAKHTKEAACGCAGCFTAHAGIELYAEVFAEMNALDKLEAFASFTGADFYGLPRNMETITLVEKPWLVPQSYEYGEGNTVVPLRAGEQILWQLEPSVE